MKHDIIALEAHLDWKRFTPETKFGVFEWKRTFIIGGASIVGEHGKHQRVEPAVLIQLLDPKGNLIVAAIPYLDFEHIAVELARAAKPLRETGILPQKKSDDAGLN